MQRYKHQPHKPLDIIQLVKLRVQLSRAVNLDQSVFL